LGQLGDRPGQGGTNATRARAPQTLARAAVTSRAR
jgi:hypothetical protein